MHVLHLKLWSLLYFASIWYSILALISSSLGCTIHKLFLVWHAFLDFTVMFSKHVTCTCVLLKWHKAKRPKTPSSLRIKSLFLYFFYPALSLSLIKIINGNTTAPPLRRMANLTTWIYKWLNGLYKSHWTCPWGKTKKQLFLNSYGFVNSMGLLILCIRYLIKINLRAIY